MTVNIPQELASFPPPEIIETLDYEAIFERQVAAFVQMWEQFRAAHPEMSLPAYTVQGLETDPAVIQIQSESTREFILRVAINEAVQSTLLAYAYGAGLDHLAAFYEVFRMSGETDARLKRRVILAIQGRSTGGTEARYRFVAMSADIRVEDAIVYTVGKSPLIHVSIFSTDADGVADQTLLSKVNAALQDKAVRMVNDTIVVEPSVRQVIDVIADVWLLPDTPLSTLETMKAALRAAWEAEQALGRDFVERWWTSKLMLPGVHKVSPIEPADITVAPFQSLSIGEIVLNFKGRAF